MRYRLPGLKSAAIPASLPGRDTLRTAMGHWLVVVLIIVMFWGSIGLTLWREHEFAQAEAVTETRNLVRAFDQNITRSIETIDETLLFVREAYEHDRAGFDAAAWSKRHAVLGKAEVQIAATDRRGKIVWSTLRSVHAGVSVADREHFRVQAASKGDVLYISKPVVGRVSKRTTIQFVRKLLRPDGSFDGIVVISIDPSYLSNFFGSLGIGNASVTVANADGIILAYEPALRGAVGEELSPEVQSQLLRGATEGTRSLICPIDGVDRIVSFRRLARYPLVVSLGLAVNDVFSTYDRSKRRYLIVGTALSIVAIIIAALLLRQRRSLLGSQRTLAATLESISQGIMMIAPDGSVPVLNRRAIELLDLPPSLTAGPLNFQDLSDWQWAHGEFGDPESEDNKFARSLREDRFARGNYVYERKRPNGTVLEVRTNALPDGGAVRTFTDITERKGQDRALAEAHARAAHAERLQALGRLAGGIAHDFNNILQIVHGGATLIKLHPGNEARAQRSAQMILDAAERGSSITLRLLSFARRGELHAGPVDSAAMLESLCEVLRSTLGRSITIRVQLGPDLPQLLADQSQLETVLVNLATNARDAMPHGGTLTFAAVSEMVMENAPRSITLHPGQYVRLSISDTGSGMDKATLAKALEPFFTTKPQDKGTGLGLPMAKGFAEQSGGGLEIDSIAGHGTTVHLWLPAVVMAASMHKPYAAVRHDHEPARILLVDDEPMVRETMGALLAGQGYDTLAAASGPEALRLLEFGEEIDVLVTDLSMPGMDGLTLIQEAHRRYPGLPAVLVTGYARDEVQQAAAGPLKETFTLLRKPITATELADCIEAARAAASGRHIRRPGEKPPTH